MRIIHTSDWHLGQYFFTKSRAAEHEAFLDWLIERVLIHSVDAIIVAGDVFDTASPPATPVNFIISLSSNFSLQAVVWWCWVGITTPSPCLTNPDRCWPASTLTLLLA